MPGGASDSRIVPWRQLVAAFAFHALVLFLAMPISPWEFDEPLFFQALHRYDPLAHHPPPPGYPVFILTAQILRRLIPGDFAALLTLSIVASAMGFVMVALALRNLSGISQAGIAGALLFYLSPAMLIHSTLPISEAGALALLATALYFASRDDWPVLFAVFAALTIGWRIQFAIFVVPLFLVQVVLMRRWRDRGAAVIAFTVVCILWLVPLTLAVGGIRELIAFEAGQGRYVAEHDAAESRTGWTPIRLLFRFVGRAWGHELAAVVVLFVAAVGALIILRTRFRAFLPLLTGGLVYIMVALWIMDPADGVRYSIPFVLVVACAAAVGATELARRFSLHPYVFPAIVAAASVAFVGSILAQRRTIASPPVRAALHALHAFPANAVALYELPLWPHATYYLAGRDRYRVDEGLEKFYDRPEVPLFIYADGATARGDAAVFRWHVSDAYNKMTRNHYRAASIIPVPPHRRFKIVSGIYGPERDQDGREWRWLSPSAELQLPRGPRRELTMALGLPAAAAIETNVISIVVNGVVHSRARFERGRSVEVKVDVPGGAPVIRLQSERSFVPAEVPALRSGDRRRLAVELYDLRTTSAAATSSSPAS